MNRLMDCWVQGGMRELYILLPLGDGCEWEMGTNVEAWSSSVDTNRQINDIWPSLRNEHKLFNGSPVDICGPQLQLPATHVIKHAIVCFQ